MLPDGAGFDKRVQIGQKEATVLTSRQSNFLVWAIRRELHVFDEARAAGRRAVSMAATARGARRVAAAAIRAPVLRGPVVIVEFRHAVRRRLRRRQR